jgi:hypothetical protein
MLRSVIFLAAHRSTPSSPYLLVEEEDEEEGDAEGQEAVRASPLTRRRRLVVSRGP